MLNRSTALQENYRLACYQKDVTLSESHPSFTYFYDHPLDHVPGLLLWHWMEEAVAQLGLAFTEVQAKFFQFCEHGHPLTISVIALNAQSLKIEMHQDKTLVAEFKGRILELSQKSQRLAGEAATPSLAMLSERQFIHKHHAENILISRPKEKSPGVIETYALPLPAGHWLSGKIEQGSLIYYGELAKQLLTYYAHAQAAVGFDWSIILNEVQLSCQLPATGLGLRLEISQIDVNKTAHRMLANGRVQFYQGPRLCADFGVKATVMSPTLLKRLGRG